MKIRQLYHGRYLIGFCYIWPSARLRLNKCWLDPRGGTPRPGRYIFIYLPHLGFVVGNMVATFLIPLTHGTLIKTSMCLLVIYYLR